MKAKDIKPGMAIGGWKVTDVIKGQADFWHGCEWCERDGDCTPEATVLLRVERGWGSHDIGIVDINQSKSETRRIWYFADEQTDTLEDEFGFPPGHSPCTEIRTEAAGQAVIAAAEVLSEEIIGFAMSDGRMPTQAESDLIEAVEALQKARDGEEVTP